MIWPRAGLASQLSRVCSHHAVLFSPPVRWGLLDFMSVSSSPPPRPLLLRRPPQLTGILWVQCGVLDPNGNWDPLSSVWRAGPQPRSYEFSVACWTPTAMLWVQCGVLDPNRDIASSVWRAGPQPRYCVFSVACWAPERVVKEVVARCHKISQIECQQICLQEGQKECVRENGQKYVRSVWKKRTRRPCETARSMHVFWLAWAALERLLSF